MGEYDFDVVTEKPCRHGAQEQGVHRGNAPPPPPPSLSPSRVLYQRAAHRTLVHAPASLACSAAPRVGRAGRYTENHELYFNIHGGTLPQRALKQLGRACI